MRLSCKKYYFFCLPLLLLALCCGCSGKAEKAQEQEVAASIAGALPHPANAANPEVHSKWVSQWGTEFCFRCHKTSADSAGTGPTCQSCHPLFPHESDWATKEKHGSYVTANSEETCKTKCHGTDLAGGLSGVSCADCHKKHLSNPTACNACHEKNRPADGIHPATVDCVDCHDYVRNSFKIPRGEEKTFDESGHASRTGAFAAESSNTSCMRCHTATGFRDYIGANDTPAEIMNATALAADTPDPLTCTACHNAVTNGYSNGIALDTSGFTPGDNPAIYNLAADGGQAKHVVLTAGREGLCLRCHAPRSNDGAIKVNAWVYGMAEDTVYTDASKYAFAQYPGNTLASGTKASNQKRGSSVDFHYAPVMSTFYGSDVGQGFQYPTDPLGNPKTYVGKNNLMPGYGTCITCHNPHTAEVQPKKCSPCHSGVSTAADFRSIRNTALDYDGDGNVAEGTYSEIQGMQAKLYQAIQNYAAIKRPIIFDSTARPPWKRSDTTPPSAYDQYTPRLVKALYNYHLLYREPGAYVHNSKYIAQLLYDSIENLNSAPGGMQQVDMTGMVRP